MTALLSAKPLLSLEKVGFSYGDNVVLESISLDVKKGDYLGIIGPNGSGKTTLLKLLLGLLQPSNGRIMRGKGLRLGYVPQRISHTDGHFPATVREVVMSGRIAEAGLFHSLGLADEQAVETAMKESDVLDLKDRLITDLSGGQRQRVYIARALASQPDILILDEPTVGVDTASLESFYSLLCELNGKTGVTIILVSHDIDVVAEEVKTVLLLNRKVIDIGPPRKILKSANLDQLYGGKLKLIEHHH